MPVRQEEEIRRQAIILLSDGEDTSSLVTFDDVLDLARRSETAIYAIGLMEDTAGGQSKNVKAPWWQVEIETARDELAGGGARTTGTSGIDRVDPLGDLRLGQILGEAQLVDRPPGEP